MMYFLRLVRLTSVCHISDRGPRPAVRGLRVAVASSLMTTVDTTPAEHRVQPQVPWMEVGFAEFNSAVWVSAQGR